MKRNVKLAATAALALSACFALTGCGRTTVNLNEYLTVTTNGYDTMGRAEFMVDLSRMVSENPKAFGFDDNTPVDVYSVVYGLESQLTGKLDKSEDLSNGDTITFTWNNINTESIQDQYPITLEFSDETIEVSDLEEPTTVDLFDGVNVTFEGIAPNGTVSINSMNAKVPGMTYTADKTNGLSNGDEVTVTVSTYSGDIDTYLISQGKKADETEKKFKVEGLASYLQKLEDLPEDASNAMDAQAQDTIRAQVAKDWIDSTQLQSITLVGNYLLVPKDTSFSVSQNNQLYFIYKIGANNNGTNVEYYYYVSYPNIMLLDDGTCSYNLGSLEKTSNSFSIEVTVEDRPRSFRYTGYQDLNSLFNEQVTTKIDKYNYESTIQ